MSNREEASGAQIAQVTKLASGTLYPILLRLDRAKWVESHWESENPRELGRPRRRFYRITGLGAKKTRAAFHEMAILTEAFGRFFALLCRDS
jgi:PadR family transcriptional regulator